MRPPLGRSDASHDLALAVPLIMDLKFRLSFGVEYQNEPAHSAAKWSTKSTFGLPYEF